MVLDNPQQMRGRIEAGKSVALQNDCVKYLGTFETMLDEFEAYRRCWP